ncbi:MAG: hypothetical protein LUE64_01455 [Candidatus Gastranaerophilales bacterium]|nr:hypothetical protein [Candidatus Gastranaerophilales bacterium]
MINPIQQNVVFGGSKNSKINDNFTGSPALQGSIRGDYNYAVSQVKEVQNKMTQTINEHTGNNLNTIA